MEDQATHESCPVPDPTVVDPWPVTVRNGQCAADGFTNHQQQQAKTPTEPDSFTVNQEMKITDSVDGEGNFFMFGYFTSYKSCWIFVWVRCL